MYSFYQMIRGSNASAANIVSTTSAPNAIAVASPDRRQGRNLDERPWSLATLMFLVAATGIVLSAASGVFDTSRTVNIPSGLPWQIERTRVELVHERGSLYFPECN